MNKLISVNYWFGCDWWLCEVGYLGMRADQLSLACAGVYLWNTGHLRVTDPRMCSGFQQATRTSLLFALHKWPFMLSIYLWPNAMCMANEIMISTPTKDSDKSLQELFSGINVLPKIKHFHT